MISVIIPTYNRYDLLLKCIESVKSQTYKDLEIIVINDCSDDNRYDNLKNRDDIVYLNLPIRTGMPAKVRNMGISVAKGEWLAFLDDDDEWLPEKLSEQMEHSEKYNFICCDAFYEGIPLRLERERHIWDRANPTNTMELTIGILNNHNLIINSSVLVKKELVDKIGGIPEDRHFRGNEDYQTWKKILSEGEFCFFVGKTLLKYNNSSHKYYNDKYV
jgi:glycosyltransferase involved in cell wall biosynthesis